jgi:ATP-dependent RNA helicase DeaD
MPKQSTETAAAAPVTFAELGLPPQAGAELLDVAAALASMARGGKGLALERPESQPAGKRGGQARRADARQATYRVEVGRRHGVQPGNIVGALAYEADLRGSELDGVDIRADYTLVRLPAYLSKQTFQHFRGIRVRGQPLQISRWQQGSDD